MSSDNPLYKEALLDHFKSPRNYRREAFSSAYLTARGRNPRCGDDVEIGLRFEQGVVVEAGFRGRGCSICIASTSLLTEAVVDLEQVELLALHAQVQDWSEDQATLPTDLLALDAVRSSPARKRCALLGWNALAEVLQDIEQ